MTESTLRLQERVAIVTGAGSGLGRAHAIYLAGQGAKVVVNDLGSSVDGQGQDVTPAQRVVDEIRAAGGEAIASLHDVGDWSQAAELVRQAVDTFGVLHVLVNNAGILRDRTLAKLTEEEWDAVIRVHLKGHTATTKHAMTYWRDRAKRGDAVQASVIHTSSIAGLAGNFGQAAYSSAKLGIVALSWVTMLEGASMGVRSNVISPSARTRLALSVPGFYESVQRPADPKEFDFYSPLNVSPLVAWLAQAGCLANGQVFQIGGNRLLTIRVAEIVDELTTEGQWTMESLDSALNGALIEPIGLQVFLDRMQPHR
jgi:NAD(P)-dependent dehydrogenase (short-subunit alcohol dehydrogenase family)